MRGASMFTTQVPLLVTDQRLQNVLPVAHSTGAPECKVLALWRSALLIAAL